jgi:tetratricopeptide (TPR) repeat protein
MEFMQFADYVGRFLLFLILSTVVLFLLAPSFRRRLVAYAKRTVAAATVSLTYAKKRVSAQLDLATQAPPEEQWPAAGRVLAAIVTALFIALLYPFRIALQLFLGAVMNLAQFVLIMLGRMSYNFALLALLALLLLALFITAVTNEPENYMLRAMASATDSVRLATNRCVILDPRELYPLDRDVRTLVDLAMEDVYNDKNDGESGYKTAIELFGGIAATTDHDDYLYVVAENNRSCLLAASPQDASNVPQMMTAATQAGWTAPTTDADRWSGQGDSTGTGGPASSETAVNSTPATVEGLTDSIAKPMILVGTARLLAFAVEMVLAPELSSDYKWVGGTLGGAPMRQFTADMRPQPIALSAEGVYCYKLKGRTNNNRRGAGEGAIFVDRDMPRPEPGFADYSIVSRHGSLYLHNDVFSFAVEVNGLAVDIPGGDTVQMRFELNRNLATIYRSGQPTDMLTLSATNKHEVVEIGLDELGMDQVDGKHKNVELWVGLYRGSQLWRSQAWTIASLDDDDVFSLDVGLDKSILVRVTCDQDEDKQDFAGAVNDLIDSVRAENFGEARERFAIALKLRDPDSEAISAGALRELCKWGSLSGNAEKVVDTICVDAVNKAEGAVSRSGTQGSRDLAAAYDSYGLALAMLDRRQAVETLQKAMQYDPNLKRNVTRWSLLARLQKGDRAADIFSEQLMDILLSE